MKNTQSKVAECPEEERIGTYRSHQKTTHHYFPDLNQ